jgi:hypothetical protein
MDDFYDDVEDSPLNQQLLSTIRVPKNLLYLTDRLPKPSYAHDSVPRNRSTEEESKRRTHEPPDQKRLPDIPKNGKQRPIGKQNAPQTSRDELVAQS